MEHKTSRPPFDYVGVLGSSDRCPPDAVFFDVASYLRESPANAEFPEKQAAFLLPYSGYGKYEKEVIYFYNGYAKFVTNKLKGFTINRGILEPPENGI